MLRRALFALTLLALPLSSVACAGADETPASAPAGEEDEIRRGGLVRQDLPSGAFRTRSEELAQEWLDANIMTGDARIDAGRVRGTITAASLAKFAEKMVSDHLAESDQKLKSPSIATPKFSDALVKDAAKVVAVDGFVYTATRENIGPVEENLRELLAFLGDTSKLDAVTLKSKIEGEDVDADHDEASLWIFVNRDTKEFVAFYAREGST